MQGEGVMPSNAIPVLDPVALHELGVLFDATCAALPNDERSQERKILVAQHILNMAAAGERDPDRLRAAVLSRLARG
jgi:hypothetical protein